MDTEITKYLLPYQIPHAYNILNNIGRNGICLDSSDTGVGKTYVAMAIASHLNLRPFIICPKVIMNGWKKVSDIFNVKPLTIVNYETICAGNCYQDDMGIKDKRKKCTLLEYKENDKNQYKWNLPNDSMIIFDEVHKCGNMKTNNGKLLMSTLSIYSPEKPVLILSATIVDQVKNFKIFSLLFNWFTWKNKPVWLSTKYNPARAAHCINQKLYPAYASRIKISELGDKFQTNSVTADCYNLDNTAGINTAYTELDFAIKNCHLADIIRTRQNIEDIKIQLFIDLTNEYLDNNYSVVIFVNFTNTLLTLAKKLKTTCIVYGEQTLKTRLDNIKNFMDNSEKVMICNIFSAESMSLHDIHGGHPRVALISPTWSSIRLIQAIGRIHRAGSKSPSLNKIIYCAGSLEEKLCNNVSKKMKNLSTINDDDLY